MSSLGGKVALITGASSGIGEGIAVHFARLKCRLSLTGRSQENLDRVAKLCQDAGLAEDQILTTSGNINSRADREAMVKRTEEKFGQINVLINNAGVAYYKPLTATNEEEYDDLFNTNVRSQVFLTKLVLPYLIQTKGNIVNTSSYVGQKSVSEVGAYCMSKASLDMFTQCLALEMAPRGVRVNSINPGMVVSNLARRPHCQFQEDTAYQKLVEMSAKNHPLGRVGQPTDCAEAAAFLASDAASFITGQILFVDGGRHCLATGIPLNVTK